MIIISIRKFMVDTDVVNDVTCLRQSVITNFMTRRYPLITATSYDKYIVIKKNWFNFKN